MTKQGTNDATIKNTAEKIVNSRISEFFQSGNNKIIAIIATQCEKWVLCKVEHLYIYSFRSVNSNSEYRKIRTRNNSALGHFSRSDYLLFLRQ